SGTPCTSGSCGACTPTTCTAQGANCGTISDGCGGQLNCGTCPTGQTCGGGGVANVCGGCPTGDVVCAGACVNTTNNPSNCGTCGNACAAGEACVAGVCTCPSGQVFCGNACVNETSDPNNCGACGHACASGQGCTSGVCGTTGAAVCGNGIREAGEQCDDGNTTNLDGCSSTCQLEQDQRVNSLALLGTTDSSCANNELGHTAFTSTALTQFNSSLSASIGAGTANQFFIFTGLTDLTGVSPQSGIQVGMIDGTLTDAYTTGFSGSSDLDWWYTFDPASVNASNVPLSQITASIVGSVLTAGPGTINVPNFF